jgi:hypothetical protein
MLSVAHHWMSNRSTTGLATASPSQHVQDVFCFQSSMKSLDLQEVDHVCCVFNRPSEGNEHLQQLAAAGMAALLFAGHPQAALAKDAVASTQVSTSRFSTT